METNGAFEWTREKIKEVLITLSHLPDFDRLLIPDKWAKEFDIPITEAKCHDLKSYLKKHKEIRDAPGIGELEIRKSDLIIRQVVEEEPLKITVQTVECTPEQPFGVSAPPIESNEKEQPENQDDDTKDLPPLENVE